MISRHKKVTPFELAILLVHAQIGVDMIALVNRLNMQTNYDGWISVLLAGVVVQILILLFGLLIKRFPNQTYFEMLEIVYGKWIGKFIIAMYCVFFTVLCSSLFAKYTIVLKSWMMPLTPKWILALLLTLICIYLAVENIQVISRFFFLATSVILLFFGFVIYSLKSGNIYHILPIGNAGLANILKGIYTSVISFQGFEYFLYIAPFVVGNRKQIIKTASFTNVFVTLFYAFVVFTCNLFFSPEEMKLIPEPIFYLIKSFTFNMIERPDLIFTSLWIVLVVTSIVFLLYVSSNGLKLLFKAKKRTIFVIMIAMASYVMSLLLYGEQRIDFLSKFIKPLIVVVTAGIPLMTILFSYLLKRTGETQP
ncbi:MAG: GerAB/ArcD/ProY family transporter [Bacilli bacterium]|nr:GerAB/ArcD/ProY family transporter [Bacilli bacterium]